MRKIKHPRLFAVLLWSALATASLARAEENEILLNGSESQVRKILIVSKQACLNTLSPLLEPEKTIAKGLSALQEGTQAASPDCLKEVVLKWSQYLPASGEDGRFIELNEQREQAARAVKCINPYADPSSDLAKWWLNNMEEYCEGKFFPKAQAAFLNAQFDKAQKQFDAYALEKELDENLTQLPFALVPKANTEQRDALEKRLQCTYGAPLPECKGLKISAEEERELIRELKQVNEKISAEDNTAAYVRVELRKALIYTGPFAPALDRGALRALNRELACATNPGDTAAIKLVEFCQANGLSREVNPEPIRKKLREMIPDVSAYLAQWRASAKDRQRAHEEKTKEKSNIETSQYSLRRLIAHQRAYAKKHPTGSLEDFCAESELEQRKDLIYVKKVGKIEIFTQPSDWRWASESGLTETEFYAVKDYTGSNYRIINEKLRKAKANTNPTPLTETDALYVEKLNQALGRADPYIAKPVRRFSFLPDDVLAAHQEGQIVTYDSFTSTSRDQEWSWKGGNSGTLHSFIIYGGKNGVDVDSISSSKGEKEVLFKSGTRFKVLSRKERRPGSNVFDFVMAEVDEAGNVIAEVK